MISWSCRLWPKSRRFLQTLNFHMLKSCERRLFLPQTVIPNQFDCNLVHVQLRGHLLSIRLHNSKRRNALNLPMYARLSEVLQFAQANQQVHAVIVSGNGKAYCSGNDLSKHFFLL